MKNKYNTGCIVLLWFFFCLSTSLHAQEMITVQGRVGGAEGPLVGVTVLIKGTQSATVTDSNGAFKIKAPKGAHLRFEFMGYTAQELEVKTNAMLVKLNQNTESLNEITINTGYYSVKEREQTGSIARITAKDIELSPVVNPLQALQGRMAGVHITQNTGIAGGGFKVEIRGKNSLGADHTTANFPLYIVDGLPMQDTPSIGSTGLSLNLFANQVSVLNGINPKDIESIEILKDADATAIYGSRGANGVVLITTKKGIAGKTRFTINSSTSFSKVGRFMEMMNTRQFNAMRDEAFANDGITVFPTNAYDMNGTWDRNRYTDWQKELIGGTAISKDIGLGVSGGNETTRFNINLAHGENGTVFPQSRKGFVRNSALINLNHRTKDDKWNINVSTNYSVSTNDLPSADLTTPALKLPPNAPALFQTDGSLNWQHNTFMNPLAPLGKTYSNETTLLVLNTQVGYRIVPSTQFKLNAGVTTNAMDEWILEPHTIINPALNRTSESSSKSQFGTSKTKSYILEPQLHWEKKWRAHSFKALVGGTFQSKSNDLLRITGTGFSSNAFINNIGLAKTKYIEKVQGDAYEYAALFARFNYAYTGKYILNLTGRRDGSSRFGPNNKFGNFGAVGVAWLFSEEAFAKELKWLSFGKLRGSYGTTGSDNIGDYMYLDTYTADAYQFYNGQTGLYPNKLYNPDYNWEKTTKLEFALEWGLWQERLNASIAWYQNRSANQLLDYQLPFTTGFKAINGNFPATVQNRGWEFTLNTVNLKKKNFYWSTNFNISLPENKLIAFPGLEESTYKNAYVLGRSINLVRSYEYKGIDPATGLYDFTDFDHNNILNASDKQVYVEREMKFHGGLQNSLSYQNFSLDFLFQFVKQTNYNFDNIMTRPGTLVTNYPIEVMNRWSSINLEAPYLEARSSSSLASTSNTYLNESNRAISDASYIRLKNVAIGYTLVLPKLGVEAVQLFVQGQNLWTWTNYYGMDPEFSSLGNLPPLRTIAFGMQLTF